MTDEKQHTTADNTEEKIRMAAKKLFTERGYAATTIRDVAEEAGVNIALLNYYFRSKDKLFKSIFAENFKEYSQQIAAIFFQEDIPLEIRIRRFVSEVTDQLKKNPDLPMFIMSECRQDPSAFENVAKLYRERFANSSMLKQLKEEAEKGNIRKIDPLHFQFLLNSQMTAPFLSMPMLRSFEGLEGEKWDQFLEERKQIVADMIIAYLKKTDD